jgi:prevent-host-death family protein
MKTIGIRELKARLSQALREVAAGDVLLITDRGRVVAELRSPDTAARVISPQDRAFARLAGDGSLRVAERQR